MMRAVRTPEATEDGAEDTQEAEDILAVVVAMALRAKARKNGKRCTNSPVRQPG